MIWFFGALLVVMPITILRVMQVVDIPGWMHIGSMVVAFAIVGYATLQSCR